ncbi:ATP-binding cassette domain-containing protein [Streptomyces colonosanans]|uniref:ABC transporter n=1 Tax=Streptomyces colonosanans TaxID=1428652 RepID=A0A1S2P2I9_9ACTN|nr:ABC transporter ATP-binding protein [Streptomyces colonosanans]OIJ87979.1 ABC transporter [Streptomyces colonosanans]
MIQAIGLTSISRKDLPPAVDDVSFEAHASRVTALLGACGAGKTTVLRLMLELQQGRGLTCFRGRPLHRIARPAQEVGALLGDVPGHPAHTVREHLRMLSAAVGVSVRRADEVLEAVGLGSLRDERLGTLSRDTDRRLGLAGALLADPHTLVLDDPAHGLSAREGRWLHGMLRAHAAQGGTVLFATRDPKEAARTADRVLTLDNGRIVADQETADFARTRLRPRVTVRSPHAVRLGTLLANEGSAAQRSVEVVHEAGNRLSVYGSTCADVGETAFRNGVLVHQLTDEIGDMGPRAGAAAAPPRPGEALEPGGPSSLPPPIGVRPAPGPLRPLRYEVRRATGTGTGYRTAAAVLVISALACLLLARIGHTPQHRLLAAWPRELPLPPAALGAGLLGAHTFGDEFRHPVLAGPRGDVPRSLGLLAAKLLVAGFAAVTLALLAAGGDLGLLYLLRGRELAEVPADWPFFAASWFGLLVGCAWAGVLAAGIFRSTSAGLAAVLAVPVLVVPLVQKAWGQSLRAAADFSARMHGPAPLRWPFAGERCLAFLARVIAQPVGSALALSVTALLCAYLLATLRSRAR